MQFLKALKYYKKIIYSGHEIILPWSLNYKILVLKIQKHNKYIH